ncbi:hypothetical protein CFK38_12295 [Brachybacterium vulturis]|uniref:DUF3710 domain-containing protein n=1 Tax=Brachybacterium vulturis TaxID=2017484 RepID=A0A291GPV6_9MICO|nr:DUF3710 domain-containing protein [Brachybacterium vulturis]ATG52217.1 hypothetical protein CFK38_12295 [Brachybacterium vulturis]
MGLFSGRKRNRTEEADATAHRDQRRPDEFAESAEPAESAESDEPAERAEEHREQDDAAPQQAAADRPEAEVDQAPRGEHLEDGPYDEADAPEEDRIDLGGLQVPTIDGMELRMEVDQRSGAVTGANLVLGGSSLQVQAFAAPKSRGLWEDVRQSLRDSVVTQGGTAETRTGAFGTELITRLPVKRADGRTGYRPARFIGVDGSRWFLRAILTGKALGDPEQSRRFETLVSRLVVVRGTGAMAPQELIPLHLPGERPGLDQIRSGPLDPLARGPEITQIG